MHPIQSQARLWRHFDSLASRKYTKILVAIRFIVCYSIPSKGEHRATPERREHEMQDQIIAKRKRSIYLVKYAGGPYAVEKRTKALGMTYMVTYDIEEAKRFFESI